MGRMKLMTLAALAAALLSGCAALRDLADYRARKMDRCEEECCRECPQRPAP